MPIEHLKTHPPERRAIIEGALLIFCAPFLLFPTIFSPGTLLALLLLLASWLWPLGHRQWLPRTPYNLLWLCWWLSLGLAILVTADPDLTLPKATGLFLGFAVWRYLSQFIHHRAWFQVALTAFILTGLAFTLMAILSVNWVSKVPLIATLLPLIPTQLLTLPESDALGTHANQLAGTLLSFMLLPLSLLIGRAWQKEKAAPKWGLLLLTAILGILLLLTQSRSGWIGGYGSLVALLTMWQFALPPGQPRRRLQMLLLLTVVALFAGLLLIGPQRLQTIWQDPAQQTALGSLETINFRFEVWRWAVMAIGDFPFTGTGLGTFRQVAFRLYPIAISPSYDIAHAHNIFLQVALDVGLPGLIVYGSFLLLAGGITWQVMRQCAALRPAAIGLMSGIIALHLYGLTDALAIGAKPGLLFWLALGLLTSLHQLCERHASQEAATPIPPSAL